MSRAVLVLNSPSIRAKALLWVTQAKDGSRVTFQSPKRTLPQNDRMWAMLTDFATQTDHHGVKLTPDNWKVLFLHAAGREATLVPSLDGQELIAIGQSSSDLSVEEMTAVIECIFAEGTARGVTFHEPPNPAEIRAGDAA